MNFGWVEIPSAVENLVNRLPHPIFGLAAPTLRDSGQGHDAFLWRAEQELVGKLRPPLTQAAPDCVSKAFAGAIDCLRYVRMAWLGKSEKFIETASEPIYAGSRIEIGGGRLGLSGGTCAAWAAEWLLKYGILHRQVYDNVDLRRYSGKRAIEWGKPGHGVPDILEPKAREYPVRTLSLLTGGYEEARDAIAIAKCPVVVGCYQGFSTIRDNQGFCTPEGTWAHCMYFDGVTDNPKRPGLEYRQSAGPGMPGGPRQVTLPHGVDIELPDGAFLVDAEVFDKMTRRHECYILSDLQGYVDRSEDFDFAFY